ncbi:DNA polymerase III subunit chi [Aliivibrio kagoshimensis]|uniref:DNA polymerase III subunit chi n=1 Tax=Aliivibrio kagoshimensis TaxID=2910230 RepID=UPI003D099E85
MSHGTFYLINEDTAEDSESGLLLFVSHLVISHYQQGMKIFILADSRTQAEKLDELLWQLEPENFIPHNLVGEGARSGALVEIGWGNLHYSGHRNLLINLAQYAPTFAVSFPQMIDFVPCEEKSKQQARERYKIYRQAGVVLNTVDLSTL